MNWLTRQVPFLRFVAAFWRTRWLQRRLQTPADVEAWQDRQLTRWRREVLPTVGFYANRAMRPLEALPVTDKALLMSRFAEFNAPGITAERGWAAFNGDGIVGRYTVGASTGTSGNRGLFVISEAERWEWLGVIVGKTLPRFPFERAKVALILPLNTRLYGAANRTRLLQLKFFDLKAGIASWRDDLAAYAPDTIIAPPKILRWLAESGLRLAPKRLFSGAEVLDPLDRGVIEDRFGVMVREIYMATEGLLGVACEYGTLHLCEDAVKFEFENPAPGSGLVSPLITDFTRSTQVMARYRMNDLLRLSAAPCPCGSPLQAVAAVEGRHDDIFVLPARQGGGQVWVTPDVLRNAIVDADRRIDDFRLVQTGPSEVELTLLERAPSDASEAARVAVSAALQAVGAVAAVSLAREAEFPVTERKIRRVERRWMPETAA